MSKVVFSVGVSLDGFIAGPDGGADNPLGDNGTKLHQWMYLQKAFRERLGMEGGETNNADDDIIRETFENTGAYILGKSMFIEGEANWPEDAPFRAPVYVLTHEVREPWERKGGTTFYFENEGIYSALGKAKIAAGDKNVRISGGANTIQQFLNEGLIDDFTIHLAPMFLANGVRLFNYNDNKKYSIKLKEVVNSPLVTHISYEVIKK